MIHTADGRNPVDRCFIPEFCLGFNHPFGGAGFRNHPPYHLFLSTLSAISNNVLLVKIEGPVCYTIYHHGNLLFYKGFFKPLFFHQPTNEKAGHLPGDFRSKNRTFHFLRRHGEVQIVHDLLQILCCFDPAGGHLWRIPRDPGGGCPCPSHDDRYLEAHLWGGCSVLYPGGKKENAAAWGV